MKRLYLVLFILISFNRAFCQEGFVKPLRNIAEVTFPDTPRVDSGFTGARSVGYYAHTFHTTYLAHLSVLRISLRDDLTKGLTDSVYKAVVRIAQDSGCRLFYKKQILQYGLHGILFAFTKHYDSIVSYRYYRCFYFNKTILTTSVYSLDSLPLNDPKITGYFKSLKLKLSNEQMQQKTFADIAFRWQTFIIAILIFLLLISLIAFFGKLANKNR